MEINEIVKKIRQQAEAIVPVVNEIVKKICLQAEAIVPVIGEDVYYVRDASGRELSLWAYLLSAFEADYRRTLGAEDRQIISEGGYRGLSLLRERFRDEDDTFEADCIAYMARAKVEMHPEVKAFLQAYAFPLVVTTVAFPLYTRFFPEVKTVAYSPVRANTEPLEPNTLYQLFGTTADGRRWVSDEEQLLHFLHAMHTGDNTCRNLHDYLEERQSRLMVVGCHVPDWLFSFLWYPISHPRGYCAQERTAASPGFDTFLRSLRFLPPATLFACLAEAARRAPKPKAKPDTEEKHYDAFLSYASEDRELAKHIYALLTHEGWSVWFDAEGEGRITPGSNYMRRITAGIQHATHYIPLVTRHFIDKVIASDSNLYHEVEIARNHRETSLEVGENYSIPLLLAGDSFRGKPITPPYIEGLAQIGLLPAALFLHINMLTVRPDDTQIPLQR